MISKQFHEDNVGLGNLVGGGDLIYSLYMRSCPPCITGGAEIWPAEVHPGFKIFLDNIAA